MGHNYRNCRDWQKWLRVLPCLDGLSIPRVLSNFSTAQFLELHCFADGSAIGFGAVCYFRCFDGQNYSCSFVAGKSRVAPSPKQTIPRLELCAAVTAVRLAKTVKNEYNFKLDRVFFWSDSTTVLSYINNTSKRRPAFETNRIDLIRRHSKASQWRWVDTSSNPAEPFSRGLSPKLVKKAVSWLKAPTFLFQDESNWPAANRPTTKRVDGLTAATSVDSIDDDIQHDNKDSLSLPITKQDVLHRIIERYSILSDAVRTSAWLLRLKQLLKSRAKGLTLPSIANESIDSKEFDAALLALIRLCQQQAFPGLVEALEVDPWYKVAGRAGDKEMKRTLQSISKYCPFVANGVIRVGGRLQRSGLPYDFKHPVVLPMEHHLTGLIILHAHYRAGHSSATYVMNQLRKRYHVVGQRRTVKQYIKRNCMICRNQKAVPGSQLMAPFPAGRVTPSRGAFEHCGVDYMGPLEIKQGRNRLSLYCCVFTCLASRAVHLEMVYDLSTDSFLMAFRRFLSVRGDTTRVMYSDNGTNFVGANSQLQKGLKRIDQRRIVNELAPRGIEWKHAPPLASHQGRIYETMIRLVRKNMNLIMADKRLRTLTDEGLQTLLKEIEHILNCRPLTELTDEVENTTTLTPMMLLSGCVDPGYPPDVFLDSDGMRSSWRACQLQADVFWDRWRSEYLHLLQRRQKWLTPQRNHCVGDLVLLVDENAHRNIWSKGVIEEVLPDRDGMVRRVRVRTGKQKIFTRDVRKLCLLECETDSTM